MLMRGGTSKGLFFLAEDLPTDPPQRDALLLALMGSPDARQIDGLGGATPLTSKVAIVGKSAANDSTELDYLFLQVVVDEAVVSDRQNCGNMVAAVGPFAVERGLVSVSPDATQATVSIRLLNTGGTVRSQFGLFNTKPDYRGQTRISGVPGSAGAITLDFDGTSGSSCGALFPTGNVRDTVAGLSVTMIDNGMPVVLVAADHVGIGGQEAPADLDANAELRQTLERIRLAAGPLMNLGDVSSTTIPKMTIVSTPTGRGAVSTRTFIPHRCHEAIGVLGAVSVATAIAIKGTVANDVATAAGTGAVTPSNDSDSTNQTTIIEHPTGDFEAAVSVTTTAIDGTTRYAVERSGIVRTARKLMDGTAFPHSY